MSSATATGVLVRIEGLIAFCVLEVQGRAVGVDLLMIDATSNPGLAIHPHVPCIGIPREQLPKGMHVDGMVAVDKDYAYWSLRQRQAQIGGVAPSDLVTAVRDELNLVCPKTVEEWRSLWWLADLRKHYPGRSLIDNVRSSPAVAGWVRLAWGCQFEPDTLHYGRVDKANGMWSMVQDEGMGTMKIAARAYKHSAHAFFPDPEGIRISGLLSNGRVLPVHATQTSRLPVQIRNVPAALMTPAELADTKDVKAYAELLADVPIAERLYPVYAGECEDGPATMTDTCGCCPMYIFSEAVTTGPAPVV